MLESSSSLCTHFSSSADHASDISLWSQRLALRSIPCSHPSSPSCGGGAPCSSNAQRLIVEPAIESTALFLVPRLKFKPSGNAARTRTQILLSTVPTQSVALRRCLLPPLGFQERRRPAIRLFNLVTAIGLIVTSFSLHLRLLRGCHLVRAGAATRSHNCAMRCGAAISPPQRNIICAGSERSFACSGQAFLSVLLRALPLG